MSPSALIVWECIVALASGPSCIFLRRWPLPARSRTNAPLSTWLNPLYFDSHETVGACNKDITVSSQADINTVNACTKFQGDVTIDGHEEGIAGLGALSMDNIQQITGDLIIQNLYGLQTVSLGQLNSTGSLKILNNTNVYKVAIPKLAKVTDFQVITNPNLKELTYSNITTVNNFQIIDTYVSSLGAFSASSVANIEVLSNTQLSALDFSAVKKTSGYINIANNGRASNITFSQLTQVGGNVSFGNAATLDISKLGSVSDDFSLYQNSFKNLSAPALQTAKKSITLSQNLFSAISFPQITEIGSSLDIINNTNFKSISSSTFPKLKSVPGSVIINGSLDNVTFPSLTTVDGQVQLDGAGKLSCDDAAKSFANVDSLNLECNLRVISDGNDDSSDDSTNESGSGGSTSKKSSASHTSVAAVLGGVVAIVAACL
ncbi:cell wall protein Ecm33 [Coemansia sp. S155-1]|nr:cell wall protein Ecm33 [Coemansia sp. S155-1]